MFLIAEQKATAAAAMVFVGPPSEIHLQLLPWLQVGGEPRSDRLPDGLSSFFCFICLFISDHFVALVESEAAMWVERKRRTTKYL